jgi:hypothetical protein
VKDLAAVLRDPMVATILGIVAVGIALLARRRKGLSYMLSDTPILGVHEIRNSGRVQILFDGAPVTEVHLVAITVKNSGNEPIRVEDFERPLQFSWAEPAKILAVEVIEICSESLRPKIKHGANEIVLKPLLLNPGDWLRIKTLVNQAGKLTVDARVVGVKRISKTVEAGNSAPYRTFLLIVVVGFVMSMAALGGEHLGLWVANGRAEVRLAQIYAVLALYLLVDALKTQIFGLRNYYRETKGSSK